jgi:hypothetical protein
MVWCGKPFVLFIDKQTLRKKENARMSTKKMLVLIGLMGVAVLAMAACGGQPGPAGPAGPQGEQGPPGPPAMASDLTCTDCHDDSTRLFAAHQEWELSKHFTGDAYERGTRASCAGCHSSEGFSERIAAGMGPRDLEEAPLVSSKPNCRTCHQIHTTYTEADLALESSDAVTLMVSGESFDGGLGNLCANCHQPLSEFPEADADGNVEVGEHWGPHHGVQSITLLGVGGAGVEDQPAPHASLVENTCVDCHMGEGRNHGMEPAVANCTRCHTDATSLDVEGKQTEFNALAAQVLAALEEKGMWADGEPVEGTYPEAEAAALWNYIYVGVEDGSHGAHNFDFTTALLQAALDALQ